MQSPCHAYSHDTVKSGASEQGLENTKNAAPVSSSMDMALSRMSGIMDTCRIAIHRAPPTAHLIRRIREPPHHIFDGPATTKFQLTRQSTTPDGNSHDTLLLSMEGGQGEQLHGRWSPSGGGTSMIRPGSNAWFSIRPLQFTYPRGLQTTWHAWTR